MRVRAPTAGVLACLVWAFGTVMHVSASEDKIHVGTIDGWLAVPSNVERPPVVLLIAGSGPTDHDGNGPALKLATLKKLSDALVALGIATFRYDKRGAGGWKKEFGRPEDFRFNDYVDDVVALIDHLHESSKFSRIIIVGHSEGGLVAILSAQKRPVDRLVLLTTAARRQGDLLKSQLETQLPSHVFKPIAAAIDAIMAGKIVDPTPPGLSIPPPMQPGIASAFAEDPIAPLRQIKQPTLIVGGGRDRQVTRLDFDALSSALPTANTRWVECMNHVLVNVENESDDLASYNQPERALAPILIESVAAFALTR